MAMTDKINSHTIHHATKNDIKPIAHLISVTLGTMNFIPSQKEESLEQIQSLNERDVPKIIDNMVIAKNKNGKIIGVCGFEENKKGDFYRIGLADYNDVVVLAVDESFRRQSIGSNLLKAIMQNSSKNLVFEAWGDNGKQANAHWTLMKNGFTHIKRIQDFYKNRGDCPLCVHREKCDESLCTCDIYLWKHPNF